MIRFPKQITSEFFEYTYTGTIMDFKYKLENLATKSKGFSVYPNLLIKLTSGSEFTVTNKFELGTFKSNPFDTSTNIKGYYLKNSLNITQVNLLVTPHSMFPLLFFLLPIFFMTILFSDISDTQKFLGFYPVTILAMLAIPIALLFISAFSKKRLLHRFVKYMDLNKIA